MTNSEPIRLKFWGVRGSIPSPGPETIKYGGNTPCIELQFAGKPLFILDAGSGIRQLGKYLSESENPIKAYIFISHYHWDHIQGLPFFKPAFKPGNHIIIYGCDEPNVKLNEIISTQMNPTYFPLAIEDMLARIEFRTIREEKFEVEGIQVQTKYLNHPGYTLGYRFNYNGKSIVYMSDNEPVYYPKAPRNNGPPSQKQIAELFDEYGEDNMEDIIKFIKNADILIHDTQYFPDEYVERKTWGHSPFDYTINIAKKANVKRLILFHHDPDHDDPTIDLKVKYSRKLLRQKKHKIICEAAREGRVIKLI